jgi:hypothetical protein
MQTGGGGWLQGTPMNTPFGRMAFLTDPDGRLRPRRTTTDRSPPGHRR